MLLHRILSSHKECAWDKRWSNNADTEAVNPLDWPESVSFLIMLLKNDGKIRHDIWS